jgi:hypothetical protein
MIHFDFTVSVADAENIMEIMRDRIIQNLSRITLMMTDPDRHEQSIEAYEKDNEYVEGLIKKMKNTRVE